MIAAMHTTRRLVLARRLAGLLVGAAAVVATVGSPAHAWQFQSSGGPLGSVTSPSFQFGDVYRSGGKYFTVLSATGPTVYRSPATTGYQLVVMNYTVERWSDAGWQAIATSPTFRGGITANQVGVRMTTGADMSPSVTTGYFRVVESIAWYDASNRLLAFTGVVPTASGEQVCGTVNPNRSCYQYAGYVYVG